MNSHKLCAPKGTHLNVKKIDNFTLYFYFYLQEVDLPHFCKAANFISIYFFMFFIFNINFVYSQIYLEFRSHYFQTSIFVVIKKLNIFHVPSSLSSFSFPPLQSVFKVATKAFGMIIYFFLIDLNDMVYFHIMLP